MLNIQPKIRLCCKSKSAVDFIVSAHSKDQNTRPIGSTSAIFPPPPKSVISPFFSRLVVAIYNQSKHLEPYVSTGVGNHQMMSCQFYRWTRPRQILPWGSCRRCDGRKNPAQVFFALPPRLDTSYLAAPKIIGWLDII